jgi:hypothetical protein
MDQGQERKGTWKKVKEGATHGPSAAQRRIIRAKGERTEAGVADKSYSLERKVLSTRWRANGELKENNESERGRCSRGMSIIRQRRKKGSTREPYYCIGWRSKAWQEHGMYNRVHSYRLADIKGASAARRVARTNGGKGSE